MSGETRDFRVKYNDELLEREKIMCQEMNRTRRSNLIFLDCIVRTP